MSASDQDTTEACPECDSALIDRRQLHSSSHRKFKNYRCQACGATFDDPVVRLSRSGIATDSLGHQLLDADPDDVATDGGTDRE